MERAVRVCLILEGTYPYVPGGVSSWAHQLIQSLPDTEFFLLTLSAKAEQKTAYKIPNNVVGMSDFLLTDTKRRARVTGKMSGRTEEAILALFRGLDGDQEVDYPELLTTLSDEKGLATKVLRSRDFWSYLVEKHRRLNPYYSFAEFFWTWINSRAILLRLFDVPIPEADLYHSLCTGYAGFVASRARACLGKPYMLTEHGIYHRERSIEVDASAELRGQHRDEWRKLFFGLSELSYRSADQVITLFEANRRLELALGAPPERSVVIPNGIDIARYTAVERKPRDGFHVGLVGRVVPIKDIKTFITVAHIVHSEIPESVFYCVGPTDEDPEYYAECRSLIAALGLEEVCLLTGPQDVRDYYAFLDLLVLTSLSEAQPLVILEAQAAGVPVVSTKVGDVPDLLERQDRFIAPPKDARGIAERIINVYRDRENVDAWVVRRRQTIVERYDRKTIFDRYGRLYRQFSEMAVSGNLADTPEAEFAAGRGVRA